MNLRATGHRIRADRAIPRHPAISRQEPRARSDWPATKAKHGSPETSRMPAT